ncbi:MAG: hypothetical protein V1913_08600 [Fibrobacterota bacterium]
MKNPIRQKEKARCRMFRLRAMADFFFLKSQFILPIAGQTPMRQKLFLSLSAFSGCEAIISRRRLIIWVSLQ